MKQGCFSFSGCVKSCSLYNINIVHQSVFVYVSVCWLKYLVKNQSVLVTLNIRTLCFVDCIWSKWKNEFGGMYLSDRKNNFVVTFKHQRGSSAADTELRNLDVCVCARLWITGTSIPRGDTVLFVPMFLPFCVPLVADLNSHKPANLRKMTCQCRLI